MSCLLTMPLTPAINEQEVKCNPDTVGDKPRITGVIHFFIEVIAREVDALPKNSHPGLTNSDLENEKCNRKENFHKNLIQEREKMKVQNAMFGLFLDAR